jgi:hypothetical protein
VSPTGTVIAQAFQQEPALMVFQLPGGPFPIEKLTQGAGDFREAQCRTLGGHFPDHVHFGDREVTTTKG